MRSRAARHPAQAPCRTAVHASRRRKRRNQGNLGLGRWRPTAAASCMPMGGQCAQPWAGRALLPAGLDRRTPLPRRIGPGRRSACRHKRTRPATIHSLGVSRYSERLLAASAASHRQRHDEAIRPHPAADRARAEADAEGRERQANPHLLRELLPRFATLRLGRSRCPVSISSRIARVMQPEANRTAPSSHIRRSTDLPAESMSVTASRSTRTDEACRRAVTLDQQRASSSTQGPASRPSSVTVAPPGRLVTEIRSIALSQGKTHTARAGRSRA